MDNDSSSASAAAALGRWWGQSPQPSPSTDVMNQLCRVCGEPAAGFHFGAFTCEGCKSFFGRTYNNLGSITECKNNGECVINKKNRTACKACRLRKCLLVGMSKSGSRYGRRSNWFKIHCLLQEQQQAAGAAPHLKDKSALAIWGESYKNLSAPPPQFDSDSKGSPTEESIPLNNNTLTKDPDRPTNPPALPNHSTTFPSDAAAAALWAARHSLFPMHLPHHHALPTLPLPFLPTFPSFPPPPSGHTAPQRNILLPFMHNFQAHSPNSPRSPQTNNRPTPTPTSPSRSRSPSICSPSPSPSLSSPHTPPSTDKHSHDSLPPSKNRPDRNKMAEEHSLALLRSLGPMQETPMDLSVRVMEVKHRGSRRKSKTSQRVRGSVGGEGEGEEEEDREEDTGSEGSDSEVIVREMKDGLSEGMENNDENFNRRKTPLDLTKSTKIEI